MIRRHGMLGLGTALFATFAVLFASSGCSSFSSGKGLSLFPARHRLNDDASDFRMANIGPLQIPRELDKQPLPPYTVEPGDVLLVQPVDLESPARLPGDQPVLLDGTINLGKYGSVQVAGKTTMEIEVLVKSAVVTQTPNAGFISVRLIARQSKVFYVLGEVNAPGVFPLAGRETVLDALMAAGGLTTNASRNNIILSRPSKPCDCRTVLPVCYENIVQLGDTTTNYQIAPGDRVYVPSRKLCESLFGSKHDSSPCCGPQSPCRLPAFSCPSGCATGACNANGAASNLVPAGGVAPSLSIEERGTTAAHSLSVVAPRLP